MPPLKLPGLYWDDHKQRYFKLPRPPARPLTVPDLHQNTTDDAITITRCRASHHTLSHLRSVVRTAHKDALIHQIQSSQFLLTDTVTRSLVPPDGLVSAFQTVCHGGRVCSFIGDTHGWFYSSSTDGWQRQFHLSSEVSSIGISGSTCIATSFGPECKILYLPLDSLAQGSQLTDPSVHISRIDSRIVHDVWTADLQQSRLVLGANKQAVVIEDIAICTSLRRLPTHSDVFALAQRENILYTGLRNGSILRFDTRVQGSSGFPLFKTGTKSTSSITALRHLRDYQLLVSFMDGRISTFDLRFPIRTPLMTFTGNFNSYTVKLPLVTDPHEKILFAAGQDNRIRMWSLNTGGPALDSGGTDPANQTVFQHPFEYRIAALQAVEEREGICLWAASGRELCKYSLGHRSRVGV